MELVMGKNAMLEKNFEVFASSIILERNSQVCIHKCMAAVGVATPIMHEAVHALSYNHC